MNSAMLNRIHRIRSYSLTLISSILILVLVSNIVSSAPTLSYLDRITARSKSNYPEDEFVFLVTYVSPKNKPPLEIKLVIDNNKYDLLPENTLDLNYTDGKDYTIRLTLNEGVHLYHIEVSDDNGSYSSLANTVVVRSPVQDNQEYTHLDVAYSVIAATIIILIPMIYGLYQMKRLSNNLGKLYELKKMSTDLEELVNKKTKKKKEKR